MKTSKVFATLSTVAITASLISCSNKSNEKASASEIAQLKELTASNAIIAENLAKFDTLDYTVFSGRDWTRLHESHSKDIKVHFPDGHTETGLEQHIQTLKAMFVYAPDTRIKEHPIKIGSGNMTAVMGYMEGTFTKPMPLGKGKFLEPTGKKFKIPMATIGIWEKNGPMTEEYLFWDNKSYMDQIMGKQETVK